MEAFQYSPLDLGVRSFRLLRLIGGNGNEIECEIFEAWLDGDDTIPFEALSYAWGNLNTPYAVKLNGRRLAITWNLWIALRNLRFEDEDRILWVDAICIDQKNEKERGHQVQQMGQIYSRADQVIFWLGQATPDVNLVLQALKQLEGISRKEESCSNWPVLDERLMKLWSNLQADRVLDQVWDRDRQRQGLKVLFERPWFKRVWILQEVAHARRAVVCAGKMVVGTRIFALAPALVEVDIDSHCQAVLDIMPGPSRFKSWWSQKRDLYTLLVKFRQSKASDPRDMIYALLGISSNGYDYHSLQPDYTKSTEQLIHDAKAALFHAAACTIDPGATMDDFLKSFESLNIFALIATARSGDEADVRRFLVSRDNELGLIWISPLVAAAENMQFAAEVMAALCEHARRDVLYVKGPCPFSGCHSWSYCAYTREVVA